MPSAEHEPYVNGVPDGYTGPRCQHTYVKLIDHHALEYLGKQCGLPVWSGAPEGNVCMFHSAAKPEGAWWELPRAVREGHDLAEADLRSLGASGLEGAAYVDLAGAKLRGADLTNVRLVYVNFAGATLAGASLVGAQLAYADFSGADLGRADLTGARLSYPNFGRANLSNAKLRGLAAVFLNPAREAPEPCETRLSGADLTGAVLPQANLFGANLSCANMSGAVLQGATLCNADLRSAQFLTVATAGEGASEGAAVMVQQPTVLQGADLRGALFSGCQMAPEALLEGAVFGPDEVPASKTHSDPPRRSVLRVRDEWHAEQGRRAPPGAPSSRWPRRWADCAAVYRQLRSVHVRAGRYSEASQLFQQEMRCLRRQMDEDGGAYCARTGWRLFELVAVYGERPWRVAGWACAVVLAFALLHWVLGVQSASGDLVSGTGWWTWGAWAGAASASRAFGTTLYFSAVTFTTLGYGDLQPATGLGRLCCGAEAVLGMTLTALFLACVVRRFAR